MKKLLLIVLFLSIVFLTGCQENTGNGILGTKAQEEPATQVNGNNGNIEAFSLVQKLDVLAQGTAFALKDPAVMEALNGAVLKALGARNTEGILNMADVLNMNVAGKSIARRMTAKDIVMDKTGRTQRFKVQELQAMANSVSPQVDIYFPVDKQRAEWYAHKEKLLVAIADPAHEWGDITSYALDGTKRILKADKPPVEPVLVITPCEHHGHHVKAKNTVDNLQIDPPPGGGGGGSGNGGTTHPARQDGARMILSKVKQNTGQCQESWALGDPEIYYSVKGTKGYSKENVPLPDIWRCTWHWDGIHHDYSWKDVNKYDAYWYWNDYGNYMVYLFYEDDWEASGTIKIKVSITDGATVELTFTIGSADDKMGSENVHKSDPYLKPYDDKAYDTGYIQFYVDWENPT